MKTKQSHANKEELGISYNLLFKLIRNNDEAAFNELYRLFYSPLCILAMRYLPDLDEAKDCVHDVFTKIWSDRDTLNIESSVKSYLITSTKNMCLNIIQRKKHKQTYEQHILNTYTEYSAKDLYSVVELEQLIEKTLSKLPQKLQTVFKMSRFEHLTYKEIAEKQNISIKTVEAYMSKSLTFLSSKLKDYLPVTLVFLLIL